MLVDYYKCYIKRHNNNLIEHDKVNKFKYIYITLNAANVSSLGTNAERLSICKNTEKYYTVLIKCFFLARGGVEEHYFGKAKQSALICRHGHET